MGLILFGRGNGSGRDGAQPRLGDLLTLLCALSFALQIILIGRFVNRENYPAILIVQIGLVFPLSLAGALLLERPGWAISPQGWRVILVTGLFATALAFFLQNRFQPLSALHRHPDCDHLLRRAGLRRALRLPPPGRAAERAADLGRGIVASWASDA